MKVTLRFALFWLLATFLVVATAFGAPSVETRSLFVGGGAVGSAERGPLSAIYENFSIFAPGTVSQEVWWLAGPSTASKSTSGLPEQAQSDSDPHRLAVQMLNGEAIDTGLRKLLAAPWDNSSSLGQRAVLLWFEVDSLLLDIDQYLPELVLRCKQAGVSVNLISDLPITNAGLLELASFTGGVVKAAVSSPSSAAAGLDLVGFSNEGLRKAVIGPDGRVVSESAANVRVTSGKGYRLLSVINPANGWWNIEGGLGAGDRIFIDSQRILRWDEIPAELSYGQPLTVSAWVSHEGETDRAAERARDVKFVLIQRHDSQAWPWILADPQRGTAFGGIYRTVIDQSLTPGIHELVLQVTHPRFQRELTTRLAVLPPPVEIKVAQAVSVGEGYSVSVWPDPVRMQPDSLDVVGVVRLIDGSQSFIVGGTDDAGVWTGAVQPTGVVDISFEIAGVDALGRDFKFLVAPLPLTAAGFSFPLVGGQPDWHAVADPSIKGVSDVLSWVGTLIALLGFAIVGFGWFFQSRYKKRSDEILETV